MSQAARTLPVPKTCSEPECDSKVTARGLCNRHYHERRRAGTLAPSPVKLSLASEEDAVLEESPAEAVVEGRASTADLEALSVKPAILSGVTDRDWDAMLAICRFREKDPTEIVSGLLNEWIEGIRQKVEAAQLGL